MKLENEQIELIETSYQIKVLYACTAGSRAWGLQSPYSDNDLGLIYYRPQQWYLSLTEKTDTIDLSCHTPFDGFGWDLKKALQGILHSNAVLLEWLQATDAYIGCPGSMEQMKTIAQQCFDVRKVLFHYLGLGNNLIHKYKQKEEITIKSYFLLIRSTLAAMWVKEKGTPPPLLFTELMTIAESEPLALLPIHKMMQLKKQAKPDKYVPKIATLDQFIADHRRDCAAFAEGLTPKENQPIHLAEQLFQHIILQADIKKPMLYKGVKK